MAKVELAGPVLAENRVDRTCARGEVHILEGTYPAVALADPAQCEQRRLICPSLPRPDIQRGYCVFVLDCPMICGAVNATPQGGKALSAKNCSFSSGK